MEELFLKIALCDTDEKFEAIVNRHLIKIIQSIETDQKKALEATVPKFYKFLKTRLQKLVPSKSFTSKKGQLLAK